MGGGQIVDGKTMFVFHYCIEGFTSFVTWIYIKISLKEKYLLIFQFYSCKFIFDFYQIIAFPIPCICFPF